MRERPMWDWTLTPLMWIGFLAVQLIFLWPAFLALVVALGGAATGICHDLFDCALDIAEEVAYSYIGED